MEIRIEIKTLDMNKTGHDKLLHLYSFFTETVLMCESLSAGEGGDEMRLMSCGHGLKFSSLLISRCFISAFNPFMAVGLYTDRKIHQKK